MKLIAYTFVILAFVLRPVSGQVPAKPIVYNHIEGESTPDDEAIKKAYAAKFTILDIRNSAGYVKAEVNSGTLPNAAKSDSGESLAGYVLVAYIITKHGRASEGVVLKTTDKRLNNAAIGAIKDWRFTPAKLKGVPIASTAAQEFNFEAAAAPKGFETRNIVLYQTNEVLEKRTPGAGKLALYTAQLQRVAGEFFGAARVPETLHIVVAVRPGGKARVWFVSSTRTGAMKELEPLKKELEAVAPVEVSDGPVAFAISARIAGGDGTIPKEGKDFELPIPKEWQDAAKKQKPPVALPDGILDAVWPNTK